MLTITLGIIAQVNKKTNCSGLFERNSSSQVLEKIGCTDRLGVRSQG